MGKIGSNLNQIAHHLNGGGGWSGELKNEVLHLLRHSGMVLG